MSVSVRFGGRGTTTACGREQTDRRRSQIDPKRTLFVRKGSHRHAIGVASGNVDLLLRISARERYSRKV